MTVSIIDKISNALSPIYRKLQDHKTGLLLGSSIKVLRISVSTPDVMGETQETLISSVIDNVIITHPYSSNVQIFEIYNDISKQIDTGAIDIWDVLPIKMQILFDGTFTTEAVSIKRGDLIIEILKDEHQNKIPLIMQVERGFGSFLIKNMVARTYELSLYRGILTGAIQNALDTFLEEN
jgi:hypothetical protein